MKRSSWLCSRFTEVPVRSEHYVVKGDKVVGRGWNQVTQVNDPTAHAEMVAIREACANLGDFQLTDCEIYTSCEPCPMCLGAIYWARPQQVYYMNTREEAAKIGFDDQYIYDEINTPNQRRKRRLEQVLVSGALSAFEAWERKTDNIRY